MRVCVLYIRVRSGIACCVKSPIGDVYKIHLCTRANVAPSNLCTPIMACYACIQFMHAARAFFSRLENFHERPGWVGSLNADQHASYCDKGFKDLCRMHACRRRLALVTRLLHCRCTMYCRYCGIDNMAVHSYDVALSRMDTRATEIAKERGRGSQDCDEQRTTLPLPAIHVAYHHVLHLTCSLCYYPISHCQ
jgi:hypothetical protein